MSDRYSFEHGNLIANHVLSAGHEALVDDFGGIVSSSVYVYTFLDDRVGACSKCLACLVPARLNHRLLCRLSHVDSRWGI